MLLHMLLLMLFHLIMTDVVGCKMAVHRGQTNPENGCIGCIPSDSLHPFRSCRTCTCNVRLVTSSGRDAHSFLTALETDENAGTGNVAKISGGGEGLSTDRIRS